MNAAPTREIPLGVNRNIRLTFTGSGGTGPDGFCGIHRLNRARRSRFCLRSPKTWESNATGKTSLSGREKAAPFGCGLNFGTTETVAYFLAATLVPPHFSQFFLAAVASTQQG